MSVPMGKVQRLSITLDAKEDTLVDGMGFEYYHRIDNAQVTVSKRCQNRQKWPKSRPEVHLGTRLFRVFHSTARSRVQVLNF
jgi:hypothetical protein